MNSLESLTIDSRRWSTILKQKRQRKFGRNFQTNLDFDNIKSSESIIIPKWKGNHFNTLINHFLPIRFLRFFFFFCASIKTQALFSCSCAMFSYQFSEDFLILLQLRLSCQFKVSQGHNCWGGKIKITQWGILIFFILISLSFSF